MQLREKKRRILAAFMALCISAALLNAPAAAETVSRTPDEVRERMNAILGQAQESAAPPFAEMVDFDDAGGFAFCTAEGERALVSGEINAFMHGRVDPAGRIHEIELVIKPGGKFGREYSMQADRLSRACMLSMFGVLSEGDIELLMDSYLYDVRPYAYRPGDRGVTGRERMCEIEVQEEVVRIDSAADPDNALRMNISFHYDADEEMRERARENSWRIRRLAQAVNECELIQTCGECLSALLPADPIVQRETIGAYIELLLQSTQAILQMENEHMHSQSVFLSDLQEICGQTEALCAEIQLALACGDAENASRLLREICALCAHIGNMPEFLY